MKNTMYDYQPAPFIKRLSAFMLDIMLLISAATGFIFLLSSLTGYDELYDRYNSTIEGVAAEYDFDFKLSEDEYNAMSEDEKAAYSEKHDQVNKVLTATDDVLNMYLKLSSLMIMNLSLGILASFLIFELAVPLCFKNGMTVGKKIFGVAVIRTDMVRVHPVQIFIRSILGKYTIEVMVPALIVMMIIFGNLGVVGFGILVGLGLIDLVVYSVTEKKQFLHDLLSSTCTCNYASQAMFNNNEERDRYNEGKY